MHKVLAHSLDGVLRIRQLNDRQAVVELRSHLFPGDWTYCVFRRLDLVEAWGLFDKQCEFHRRPLFTTPVVQPGV